MFANLRSFFWFRKS